MDTWVNSLHSRASILHEQIALAMEAQRVHGVDMAGMIATYQSKLAEVYGDSLPLAQLMDTSDLILHAEGPAARHHAAGSGAVAWLCSEAEKRIRQLGMAALKLSGEAVQSAEKDLRILLNGLAPGSLYLGFSVDSAQRMAGNQQAFALEDLMPALDTVRDAVRALPSVPQFIGDESVDAGFSETISDPVLRDATLMAAYHLSPTGKRGIHTVEISAPRSGNVLGSFTNRERVVLRESAVRAPLMRRTVKGSFVGELREVDLDARRFHLRDVPNIGSLRCVLGDLNAETARRLIGHGVKVSGDFEADAEGRPRLMRVESVEPFQVQSSIAQ
jgi:hypothetical protein